jgi:hypothetical protein
MRAVSRALGIVGVLAAGAVANGRAQKPQTREGFWIGLGLGYGSASLSSSGTSFADSAKGGSATGYFKLGGTLNPNVLLGAEFNGWAKSVSDLTEDAGNASVALYLYPAAKSGFFVKGGVGWAVFRLSESGRSTQTSGVGLLGGLGYDIRIGRMLSLTPTGNVYWGSDGDLSPSGTGTGLPSVKHTVFDFGLGLTFH